MRECYIDRRISQKVAFDYCLVSLLKRWFESVRRVSHFCDVATSALGWKCKTLTGQLARGTFGQPQMAVRFVGVELLPRNL